MHDILNGIAVSRALAEFLADEIEQADPKAAAVLRQFAEELWAVWTRFLPVLPTNRDIDLCFKSLQKELPLQVTKGN